MDKKIQLKPVAAALGATFAVTLAASPIANAADNPFSAVEFQSGYMVADGHAEGKCGEGKCGAEMHNADAKAKAAEAKAAGQEKAADAKKKASDKAKEMKCGEGKCGSL